MNIPDAVIFSTVVSIMTFILGFVIREWILFYSRNKRLRTTDGFIKWHLNNIVSSLSKQIKGYDILSSCIKSEGYRNWFVEPSLEPKIIIERQESIHTILYYRKKSKTDEREKLFYSIISNCRLIDLIVAETEKLFERMNNEILEHESKLDNIGVLIYQKIVGLQIKEDVNNTEKFIIETYNNFNPAVPKRSLLNDNVNQSIENNLIKTKYEHLLDFVELTSQYQKDFGFYKNSLDQFNLKVIEYRENLNSVYEDLTLTIDNYNNLKYKSNLF